MKAIGPAARATRFLLITPSIAGLTLWAARGIEPRPWTVLRFLWLDARAAFTRHEFYFNGHWLIPGWRYLYPSYEWLAGSWRASLTVGLAIFIGGLVATGLDRLVRRWHRSPK
ncbi:hypothetical protein A9R16_006910 [Acidiferrobacter thiooxydans]|jgi:hypothetical protein|uniref:hypothetical protein n=1 Tax=Acidiferrobacter thiooxydans TaxID=163359 RepID=UPI0008255A9A|nr:hypothetical protein [Acidiferrobacter thiooxydans]UEO01119.1 hypothetical protein A9R16_006910 [Acidiferrobacter thiooxydans]